MKCRFCLTHQRLIKAHIIPDSMNGVVRGLLGDGPNAPIITIDRQDGGKKRYAMGPYDRELLCGPCDGTFSPWENHGLCVLFRNHSWSDLKLDIPRYTLNGADYGKLKLFVLSVIWRASITTNSFFSRVQLSEKVNDELRHLLRAGDPDKAATFAVRLIQFHTVDWPLAMFEPREETIDGVHYVVLYLPGYKLLVKVDPQPLLSSHRLGILQPGAKVTVLLESFRTSAERRAVLEMARKVS